MSQIELDDQSDKLKQEIDKETWRVRALQNEIEALRMEDDVQLTSQIQDVISLMPGAASLAETIPLARTAAPY